MANTIFKKKENTKLTKKEAIEAIKKAWKTGSSKKLADVQKNYKGDFEEVFTKAMTDGDEDDYTSQIDMLADRVIRNLTVGTEWESSGNYTNEYQANLDKFRIYSLVIKMNEDGVFLPESILDERLMARLNNAAHDLGYDEDEDIYELDKNEDGKYEVDTTKKCINPKRIEEKDLKKIKNEDLRKLFEIQLKDIEEYLIETGKFGFAAEDDEEEDFDEDKVPHDKNIDTSDLPHWMRVVREARIADGDNDDEDDEDEDDSPKKKSSKKSSKKEENDSKEFVVKKSDDKEKKTTKKLAKSSKKEEDKQEIAVVNPQLQAGPAMPQQQIFYGYNPATGEPAHTVPMPTAQTAPAVPQVPVKKEEDIDDIFASLISDDQQEKLESAFEKVGEEKTKEILSSDEFKNGVESLINMIINADNQKEGAKSTKKLNRKNK